MRHEDKRMWGIIRAHQQRASEALRRAKVPLDGTVATRRDALAAMAEALEAIMAANQAGRDRLDAHEPPL